MSHHLLPEADMPSDPELIAAVRAGDADSYGLLFERHRASALSLARQIAGPSEADDLVSDAFMKVHSVLARGGGPDVAFRAYLLTAVRRLHIDRIRATSKVMPSDDLEQFDPGTPFSDPAVSQFENAAAARAFASLPERWQLVLWHLEVEQQKPADVAPLLGLSPNSVSALAYRAREGLRQAYLQMHLADTAAEECRWVTERMGARVRKGLSRRDAAKVDEHLDGCTRCAGVYLELSEVNSNLSGIIAPALLGSFAAAYVGSMTSVGTATGGGLLGLITHAGIFATAPSAATVAGTAASVVAVGMGAVVVANNVGDEETIQADIPAATSSAPGRALTTGSPAATTGRQDTAEPGDRTPGDPKPGDRIPGDPRPGERKRITAAATSGLETAPTDSVPTVIVPPPIIPTGDTPDPSEQPTDSTTPTESAPVETSDQPPAETTPPPETTPPVEPPPPVTPSVDVTLALSVAETAPHSYEIGLVASTTDAASSLIMSIDVSEFDSMTLVGWSCPQPSPGTQHYECAIESAIPGQLSMTVVFPDGSQPTVAARVDAAANDDPDNANNSVSWTG